MQNLPIRNWSVRLTCDQPGSGVMLPYHDYLEHIAAHPKDEQKLLDMRVLIEEPALLPSFKYVSEQVNDDQCLYLLYKLRHALKLVHDHGIAPAGSGPARVAGYIEEFWRKRGLYPGLGVVVALLSDLSEGEAASDAAEGQGLVQAIRDSLAPGADLLTETFNLLEAATPATKELEAHKRVLRRARRGLKDYSHLGNALRKLSLFALTYRQVARILFPDRKVGPHPFAGKAISPDDIGKNPYLLCENYIPATSDESEQSEDLDREERTDAPIGYFTIDIGMFPDDAHLEPNEELQDLTLASPERLRAFVIEALRDNENLGHSFAPLATIARAAQIHPIFYRNRLDIDAARFVSPACLKHFRERLHIEQADGETFFYLTETRNAEVTVERCIKALLQAPAHQVSTDWIDDYVKGEADEIACKIPDFDRATFEEERKRLLHVALENRLSIVTGRPGSGKTHAIRELLAYLSKQGQKVTVLAPTGKAALRARMETKFEDVQTIDRWIYSSGLREYVEDLSRLPQMAPSPKRQPIENLVIDEMSMVNLAHMSVILRALETQGTQTVRRLVLIGDENQLPPIGCGRPLLDILNYLQLDAGIAGRHWVSLRTNCRQRRDQTILHAAQLFAGKNRYHLDLWDKLRAGGKISDSLEVIYWKNPEELHEQVSQKIDTLIGGPADKRIEQFNLLLGLYDNGFAPGDTSKLGLDNWQLLTPYRAGASGALGLNQAVRLRYRARTRAQEAFGHGDKLIRIHNYYFWNKETKRKELKLSNGSIGVLCNHGRYRGEKAYFPEAQWPFKWAWFDEEDFELAYAITVHKSQGSEFDNVFFVIPERRSLLSRELIYTAMTRSKGPLTIFIQKSRDDHPLDAARERSDLLTRNSSLFARPMDASRIFQPEKGVRVKSKIEYLIYEALRKRRDAGALSFIYEEPRELTIEGQRMIVHPDFTIRVDDRTYYWEHLGMLDRLTYSRSWRSRVAAYEAEGLAGTLITTDDMAGVREATLQQVIEDLVCGSPRGESSHFSQHHYQL